MSKLKAGCNQGRRLIDWWWPVTCVGCGKPGVCLCVSCEPNRRWPWRQTSCPLLGEIPVYYLKDYQAPGMRRLIWQLKFGGRQDVVPAVINRACGYLFSGGEEGNQAVSRLVSGLVPVPQSRYRFAERGYNQAALIAAALSRRYTPLPVLNCLRETGGRLPSHLQTRAGRLRQAKRISVTTTALPPGSTVWLVDDVVTTGATAHRCQRALAQVGVRVAGVIALAYTRSSQATAKVRVLPTVFDPSGRARPAPDRP